MPSSAAHSFATLQPTSGYRARMTGHSRPILFREMYHAQAKRDFPATTKETDGKSLPNHNSNTRRSQHFTKSFQFDELSVILDEEPTNIPILPCNLLQGSHTDPQATEDQR